MNFKNTKNFNNRKTIINVVQIALLSLVVFLSQQSHLLGNNTLLYFSSFVFILLFLIVDKKKKLIFLMFMLPNNQYIKIENTSIITIALLVFFLEYALFKKERVRLVLILGTLVFLIFGLLFHFNKLYSIIMAVKIFLYLFFFEVVFDTNKETIKELMVKSFFFLSLGIIISSIITIGLNPNAFDYRFSLSDTQSTNTLGILSGLMIGVILTLFDDINEKKVVNVIFMISIILIGLATQSRSFFVPLIISLIWGIFVNFRLNKQFVKLLLYMVLVLVFFLGLFYWSPLVNDLITTIINRFLSPEGGDISSSRFTIWQRYIYEIKGNMYILFFGTGKSLSEKILMAPHNIWIEQIYHFGILGNVLIIGLFCSSFNIIKENIATSKRAKRYYLPLILFIATSTFSHSFIGDAETLFFYMFIMMPFVFSVDASKEIGSPYKKYKFEEEFN